MYGYRQKPGEWLHISYEISIIEFSMNVLSKYTQQLHFTHVFINSHTCFGLFTTIIGAITRFKYAGELIKNGVSSFVYSDALFVLSCERYMANTELH